MTMPDSALQAKLEALMDSEGLSNVLDAMETVAYEKAEHLAANWQDQAGEENWNYVARKLSTLAHDARTGGL